MVGHLEYNGSEYSMRNLNMEIPTWEREQSSYSILLYLLR